MINLPPKLTPSELLCCEELATFIDELLQSSRSLRREGRLPEAERCALDVIEASQEPGTNVSQAVALIHLADVHREMGKLGPALADCQKARPMFQRQSSHCQRHNEAVTVYALGLAHQLLGSEMDALRWYREADQLFEGVSRTDANLAARIWVPIVLSEGEEPGFAVAELEIDRYTVGRQLTVNGDSFRTQPLKGNRRVSLAPGIECYALRIPDEARGLLGANEGDYALVVREKKVRQEGPGVLETLGGPEFGNFERDDAGKINFIRPDATVIGGDDIGEDLQVGYISPLSPLFRPPLNPPQFWGGGRREKEGRGE